MRVETGPLSDVEARESFEGALELYLEGGERLLTGCGQFDENWPFDGRCSFRGVNGADPSKAVAASCRAGPGGRPWSLPTCRRCDTILQAFSQTGSFL